MTVYLYDQNATPSAQLTLEGPFYARLDSNPDFPRRCFHRFRNQALAHDGGFMSQIQSTQRAGVVAGAAVQLFNTRGPINSSAEFQGKLWMGTLATGDVNTWDGHVVEIDQVALVTAPVLMAIHRETLLAFGTHSCKKRNLDGSWSSVTMPVSLTAFHPRAWFQYRGSLYVGGYDDAGGGLFPGKILAFDGTTLTVARTITNAGGGIGVGVTDLLVWNGVLFYAHNDPGSSASIGRYDGVLWDDDFKDLFAQIGSVVISAIAPYRGALAVGLTNGDLYLSPTSVGGTYDQIATLVLTGIGDLVIGR